MAGSDAQRIAKRHSWSDIHREVFRPTVFPQATRVCRIPRAKHLTGRSVVGQVSGDYIQLIVSNKARFLNSLLNQRGILKQNLRFFFIFFFLNLFYLLKASLYNKLVKLKHSWIYKIYTQLE